MAYHQDYHPYASYPAPTYVDQRSATPLSHNPVSPTNTNNERLPIPQSPSSFIYNRNTVGYQHQQGVYGVYPPSQEIKPSKAQPGNEEGNHTPYHQQYHSHGEPPVSAVYRHHPVERSQSGEDQRHRHPQHAYIPPVQHQREYHQDPRPPSTPQQIPSPEIYSPVESSHALSEADDRLMRYHFPHDSQAHLRRALFHVLHAPWKRANEREPTDEALLQFTTRNMKLYQCSFSKAEGRCVKEFDRKDRVLDHIRTHIDLQPFVCRDAGCYQRFCSKPDLLQHEKNKEKTICDQCGARILPKNLARHKQTTLCRNGRWPVNGQL